MTGTSFRHSIRVFALIGFATGCSAFLRTGFVEERPTGRTLVLPAQTGHEEARGFTKTFEPTFVRLARSGDIELSVMLSPHARVLDSYLPTPCDRVVVSRTDTDGVGSRVRYENHGGGRELFIGRFAPSDLAPFATDEGGRITLCDYTYRFGGRGLAQLVR